MISARLLTEKIRNQQSAISNSPSPDPSFVFLLEHVRRVQIEGSSGAGIRPAELRVAPVADGEVFEPSVDDEIDQSRAGQNAVRDQVAAQPVKAAAHECADDDHREADPGIEVL